MSKEEIKEMLNRIKLQDNTDYILHYDKAKALLDYITNLENKVNELKAVEKYYRQRTKDLEDTREELGLMECRVKNANEIISKMQRYKINRAIEILERHENKAPIEVILNDIGKALYVLKGGFKK